MKKIVLILTMSLLSIAAYSQDSGPPEEEDQVPIDGGISLLFAAGAAWGIKKLKDKK